jgi:RES domain-containing protein
LPDPELVQRVDGITPTSTAQRLYRLMSARYPATSGEGARTLGGRWKPPDSFPTLYLASTLDTAVAEVRRAFAAQGRALEEAVGLVVYEFDVELNAVLDLRDIANLNSVGLSLDDVRSSDRRRCQAVGDAAHFVGLEAICAPSATGPGEVMAIFTDKQHPQSVIAPGKPSLWAASP